MRLQIEEDRKRALSALEQASVELFKALPNFRSFQDHLSMEYRRESTLAKELSILVVTIRLQDRVPFPAIKNSLFGDAAKAISRKLREQDSFYLLQPGCFGVICAGTTMQDAQRISVRLVDGLTDAAGLLAAARRSIQTDESCTRSSCVVSLKMNSLQGLPGRVTQSDGMVGVRGFACLECL